MAATFEEQKHISMGSEFAPAWKITLDASYPTGGYSISASDFGLSVLELLVIAAPILSGAGVFAYAVQYDPATGRMTVWRPAAAGLVFEEVPAGTALCWCDVMVLAIGH